MEAQGDPYTPLPGPSKSCLVGGREVGELGQLLSLPALMLGQR